MLEWAEEYDENDNTIYSAPGVYTDECGSPEFYYRIRPVLEDNQIKYTTEGTDFELIPTSNQGSFESLGGAKVYCEVNHAEHCRECGRRRIQKPSRRNV